MFVYLTDCLLDLCRAPIDEGNEKTAVIDKDLTTTDGLAVDWIYNHIYWTDAFKDTIELANFEGNMRKTLIKDRVQEPRAIALNPLEGWMFFTDWGQEPRIERAGMDGTHRSVHFAFFKYNSLFVRSFIHFCDNLAKSLYFLLQVIVGSDVKWPNGLTLDLVGRRVYWVDAKLNIIGSCNYDGSGRRTVLYSLDVLRHPFSITTFEDYIYWTDWDKASIYKANKFTGKEIQVISSLKSLQQPMAVHVYHPYRQPDGVNQCQAVNGHCSHLCLPAPKINSRSPLLSCACPDGLKLLPDGLMCVENGIYNSYTYYILDNILSFLYLTYKYSFYIEILNPKSIFMLLFSNDFLLNSYFMHEFIIILFINIYIYT